MTKTTTNTTTNNIMHYKTYGDSSADALVLLHSGGMTGEEWQPQVADLSMAFYLLVPDLPGHGQTLLANGTDLSVAHMGEAVLQMLSQAGVDKAHILGSSMGGAVALWIAVNYPHVVDKLILYRIGHTKNTATYKQTQKMADPEYWRRYGLQSWLSRIHLPQGGEDAWQQVIARVSQVMHPDRSSHSHSLATLASLAITTLLIAGDRDPLIPLADLLAMYQALPQASLWVLPGADHITACNTWRAPAFNQEVKRFLRS